MRTLSQFLLVLLAAASLASCTVIKVNALTPERNYAVVSTFVARHLQESSVKLKGRKHSEFSKLEDRANGIAFRYLTGLRRAVPFRITHGKTITHSSRYRRFKPRDKDHGFEKLYKTASGYQLIWGKDLERMGQLARELKVDGVMIVYHQINISEPADQLDVGAGLALSVSTVITAYDREGKQVLFDNTLYSDIPAISFHQKKQSALNDVLDVVADNMEAAGQAYGESLKKKIGWHGGGKRPF